MLGDKRNSWLDALTESLQCEGGDPQQVHERARSRAKHANILGHEVDREIAAA